MNDPDVDEQIEQAARDIEKQQGKRDDPDVLREEEVLDYLDPSRWWFASTACPLIAGTFGPIATSFSICALVQPWRLYIPPEIDSEAHGENIPDPRWMLAMNAVSLVLALLANLSLLLNMTRRISFRTAQPITIGGWFLSSFLLIALVGYAGSPAFRKDPREEHALSQAFYYAIMAAALYCIISCLLIVTIFGAYKGKYAMKFHLTLSQRTLMLQTMALMGYMLFGALIFKYTEGWQYLDAVYWADFTLLTIGIGDFAPQSHLGRSLLLPYAFGGIVSVGLVIGSIRTLVLERGKRKMKARFTEKNRAAAISSINHDKRTIKISYRNYVHFSQEGLSEAARREQEFHVMRHIQHEAEKHRKYLALGLSLTAALALWFGGAAVFQAAEHEQEWTYFMALYFSYTTLLTIGYGKLNVLANSGKAFFVFWTLLAVPTLTILISNMGDTVVSAIADFTIWAGAVTIMPSDAGFKASLRAAARRLTRGARLDSRDFRADRPPGFEAYSSDGTAPGKASTQDMGGDDGLDTDPVKRHAQERILQHAEDAELQTAALQAAASGEGWNPTAARDAELYRFVLARELRRVLKDQADDRGKEYSYHEWAWFLKLLGQDEEDEELHREPLARGEDKRAEKEEKELQRREKREKEKRSLGMADGQGKGWKWSWLGTRSPLMGAMDETDWLVERFSARLEKVLAGMVPEVPVGWGDVVRRRDHTRGLKGDRVDGKDYHGEGGSSRDETPERKKDQ